MLVEEEGLVCTADNDGDSEEAHSLRPLQAAACTYRIAFGPRAGQKVLNVQGAKPVRADHGLLWPRHLQQPLLVARVGRRVGDGRRGAWFDDAVAGRG